MLLTILRRTSRIATRWQFVRDFMGVRRREARVQVLGEFGLSTADGDVRVLDSARAQSLLAYLVLHPGQAHSRQRLAGLLWPDSAEGQARTNLRHLLHTMRQQPGVADLVVITARTIAWRQDLPYVVDAAAFEKMLDGAAGLDGEPRRAALTEAVTGYTGDLLAGHDDQWVIEERDRLRGRFLDALEELGNLLGIAGGHAAAAQVLERLVREDPLRESAYRALMLAYQALNDNARAVRTYHVCASTLERELGVRPSAAVRAVYTALVPAQPPGMPRQPQRRDEPNLVGRRRERNLLTQAWRVAASGPARLVVLTGDPGIGKSRLAEAFALWCARQGAVTASARAHAAEGALSYAPIVGWLRSPSLRHAVAQVSRGHQAELARLLPELLVQHAELPSPQLLTPDEQRHRLFDAVTGALRACSGPVVLVADDLHLFDRESLELLHYLVRGLAGATVLVVATARPEDADRDQAFHGVMAGLRALGRLSEVDLAPLTHTETAALAGEMTRGELQADDLARLYAETEGNPLFDVESLRAGWPRNRALSPKVQAAIESRLSLLSHTARDVLDVAATIGREFSVDTLTAACSHGDDDIVAGLDELWLRRVIRERGADGYDFTHDKIREVAYGTITPPRRMQHHRRVADALAEKGAGTPDELCGQIAGHYQRAGAITAAVPWTLRAADAATRLHAYHDAIRLLNRALDLLRTVPDTPGRRRLELQLLTALPGPLCATLAYSAPKVFAVQTRALELAGELGVGLEPPLVRSLALTCLTRSDFDGAQRYGEQLLDSGQGEHDDVLVVEGAYVLGVAAFWQARFEVARRNFELATRRYRPEHRALHLVRYGQDPLVVCTGRLANTLWFLGEPEESVLTRDAALALAESTGHPYTRTVAFVFAALLALDMGDEPQLRKYLDELNASEDFTAQNRLAIESLTAYVDVLDGQRKRGMGRLHKLIAAHQDVEPAPGLRAWLRRVLLAAALSAGDEAAAREACDALLTMGGAAAVWRAEAVRVRDLLPATNP